VLNNIPTIIRTISSIAIGRFMIFLALIISKLELGVLKTQSLIQTISRLKSVQLTHSLPKIGKEKMLLTYQQQDPQMFLLWRRHSGLPSEEREWDAAMVHIPSVGI